MQVLTGQAPNRVCRMLSGLTMGRGVKATMLTLLAAITIAGLAPAAGGAGPITAENSNAEDLPALEDVVAAYSTMRRWLDAFELPDPDEDEAKLPLGRATGVCVVLRHRGQLIGLGRDTSGGDLMARRALARAMGQVLADPSVSNLPDEFKDDVGLSLTMQLEVAGQMKPLLGHSTRDFAEQIEPGLDGLALRRGSRLEALFPTQMLAQNTADDALAQMPGLAIALGLDAGDVSRRIKDREVSAYRFRTIQLAQASPRGLPFKTIRNRRVVEQSEVTLDGILQFADGIAAHLRQSFREIPEPEPNPSVSLAHRRLMGTYRPITDNYQPMLASPTDQALAAMAMARYATTPGVSETDASVHRMIAVRLLHELAAGRHDEPDPLGRIVSCAALVHACCSLPPGDLEAVDLLDQAIERILASWRDELGFVDKRQSTGALAALPPSDQAIIAAALASAWRRHPERLEGVRRYRIRGAIDHAWSTAPAHQHVSLLPWIGWAELDYAAATGRPIMNAARLTEISGLLQEARVTAGERPDEPDLAGGFELAAARGFIKVNSQSARPAAWMATALGMPEQIPIAPSAGSIADARQAHLRTMRFLMQLAVTEQDAWWCRNPERAIGGISESTWNANQPVAAQALCLMAAAETLISLDAFNKAAEEASDTPAEVAGERESEPAGR